MCERVRGGRRLRKIFFISDAIGLKLGVQCVSASIEIILFQKKLNLTRLKEVENFSVDLKSNI